MAGGCLVNVYTADTLIRNSELSRYIFTSLPWDDRVRGVNYRAVSGNVGTLEPFAATDAEDSPQVFSRMVTARFGPRGDRSQLLVSAIGALACLIIQKSIESSGAEGNFTAADMVKGSQLVSSPSHYGHLSLDIWNRLTDVNRVVAQMSSSNTYNLLAPNAGGVGTYRIQLQRNHHSDSAS